MSDTKITKLALANSLMEMMEEMPFEDIKVTSIAAHCNLNRKSFYYHFLDKYDLVCWIFDNDLEKAEKKKADDYFEAVFNLCETMMDNKGFYQKALLNKGQNCLRDHLKDCLSKMIAGYIKERMEMNMFSELYIDFLADSMLKAIEKLLNDDSLDPFQFVNGIKAIIQQGTAIIVGTMTGDNLASS